MSGCMRDMRSSTVFPIYFDITRFRYTAQVTVKYAISSEDCPLFVK